MGINESKGENIKTIKTNRYYLSFHRMTMSDRMIIDHIVMNIKAEYKNHTKKDATNEKIKKVAHKRNNKVYTIKYRYFVPRKQLLLIEIKSRYVFREYIRRAINA